MVNTSSPPRAGLVRLTAEWFDTVAAFPALSEAVKQDGEKIHQYLSEFYDLSGEWKVSSQPDLAACCRDLRALEVDLVILVYQVWAEDYFLNDLLQAIGERPLLVWCYQPWRNPPRPASFIDVLRGCGPVGTLEGLGTICNLGKKFLFVHGAPGEARLTEEMISIGTAARVRSQLRSARFGLLPARNEQMQSTFVDEFRLRADIGPRLDYLSVAELQEAIGHLDPVETAGFVERLVKDYPLQNVGRMSLESAARASLGLAHLAEARNLDLVSMNDISPELHRALGLRPCLYPDLFYEKGIQASLEGDLGAAVCQFILAKLTKEPLLFCEFWFWDEDENLMVGGHAGIQDPRVAGTGQVTISQDYEYEVSDPLEGAHYQFVAKPGRVTLLHLHCTPRGWQGIVAGGEAQDCPPWITGYPHAVVKLDASIANFLHGVASVGSTQHWIMAYGDHLSEIDNIFRLLGLPLLSINNLPPARPDNLPAFNSHPAADRPGGA